MKASTAWEAKQSAHETKCIGPFHYIETSCKTQIYF